MLKVSLKVKQAQLCIEEGILLVWLLKVEPLPYLLVDPCCWWTSTGEIASWLQLGNTKCSSTSTSLKLKKTITESSLKKKLINKYNLLRYLHIYIYTIKDNNRHLVFHNMCIIFLYCEQRKNHYTNRGMHGEIKPRSLQHLATHSLTLNSIEFRHLIPLGSSTVYFSGSRGSREPNTCFPESLPAYLTHLSLLPPWCWHQ